MMMSPINLNLFDIACMLACWGLSNEFLNVGLCALNKFMTKNVAEDKDDSPRQFKAYWINIL